MRYILSLVLALSFFLTDRNVSASCWDITDTEGLSSQAIDFWHIKNKLNDRSMLMGSLDGKDAMIDVSEIRSIKSSNNNENITENKWGSNTAIILEFKDGSDAKLISKPDFYIQTEADKSIKRSFITVDSLMPCHARLNNASDISNEPGLLEFSAPATGNAYKEVRVTLYNGDILDGVLLTETILWKTKYALLEVNQEMITSVNFATDSTSYGKIEMTTGGLMQGTWPVQSLELKLNVGQTILLRNDLIQYMVFSTDKKL